MSHLMNQRISTTILFFILCCLSTTLIAQNIQSPSDFLPHNIGEKFTPHHQLVDYFEYVAENSDQVILRQYGRTYEDRPLILAFVSSKENLAKLDEIQNDNLIRAGVKSGTPKNNIPIIWLSYSVHGNEAAGSESSMPVIYSLVSGNNPEAKNWLKDALIIMDPSVNPDGYSRYTHWVRRVSNNKITTNPDSWEHNEPHPGGRMNHYMFDLNRDWAWQTQIESQHRMAVYNEWLPQVHADLHEMHKDDPYYFAPAAQPYHTYITDWQNEFQFKTGKNHAKYFDQQGWLYYTKEIFDLFYPSYGDTYPIFNGAIGMTYEQGGSGSASREVDMVNGETVSLRDRIEHHTTTSLSTIEAAHNNKEKLLDEFGKYFKNYATNPIGKYKSFVVKNTNTKTQREAFLDLLDKNKIKYGLTNTTTSQKGYEYATGKTKSFSIDKNDIIINAYQPKSVLVQVLLEPQHELVDSLTYDITAWSLIHAYGLTAYATESKIPINSEYKRSPAQVETQSNAYGYLAKWESLADAKFIGQLMDQGVTARAATAAFTLEGKNYEPGTLIITRGDNRKLGNDFHKIVLQTAKKLDYENLNAVSTGFAERGSDLGSESSILLKKPKVAVLAGDKTSPYSFGQIWHFFETDLNYPIVTVPVSNFSFLDFDEYSLIILPDGWYRLSDSVLDKLKTWIRGGGRVIVVGGAMSNFEEKSGFNLEKDSDESNSKRPSQKETLDSRLEPHSHSRRKSISNNMPGAIYRLDWDNTHPLGYGMPDYYFSLKTSRQHYPYLKNASNVGYIKDNPMVLGFAGAKARRNQENTSVFAVQDMGRGNITYMVDNPLFRAFWYQGKMVFSNAVFVNQ